MSHRAAATKNRDNKKRDDRKEAHIDFGRSNGLGIAKNKNCKLRLRNAHLFRQSKGAVYLLVEPTKKDS